MENGIYYLGDQFGCKFVKIISSDGEYINLSRCTSLTHIIKYPNKFFSNQPGGFICDGQRIKISIFKKLLSEFSYNSNSKTSPFRGCFPIPIYIVNSILNDEEFNISDFPYLGKNYDQIMAKKLTEQGYRQIRLDILLED